MPNSNGSALKRSKVMAVRMPPVFVEKLEALDGPSPSTSAYLILTTVLSRHPGRSLTEIIRILGSAPLGPPTELCGPHAPKQRAKTTLRVVSGAATGGDASTEPAAVAL